MSTPRFMLQGIVKISGEPPKTLHGFGNTIPEAYSDLHSSIGMLKILAPQYEFLQYGAITEFPQNHKTQTKDEELLRQCLEYLEDLGQNVWGDRFGLIKTIKEQLK